MINLYNNRQQLMVHTQNWKTYWNKRIISLDEIVPVKQRDSIPSIDNPQFVNIDTAKTYLSDQTPVISVQLADEARAYPLEIMMWHEIVNDTINGIPITVTYCPLCSSEFVYSSVINGKNLQFGTSGLLRNSNLIMYDRQTDSLWQQFTGQALIGDYVNRSLNPIPSNVVSFKKFYSTYPNGLVLSRNTGFIRDYGNNPYVNYDQITNQPLFFKGIIDTRLPAMQRVLGIQIGNNALAYPLYMLQTSPIIYNTLNNVEYVIFYNSGMSSALDSPIISEGKDVGMTGVFIPYLNGERLNFTKNSLNQIIDTNTNSTWSILGKALSGPLKGIQLTPLVHGDVFWFAWSSFYPNTSLT
ncbi:DUF3179 domain-containing protein [Mycoplasmatota bacterium]|nr:DUF3179 domain-containing protein [Mycoplasmatota bacterium]